MGNFDALNSDWTEKSCLTTKLLGGTDLTELLTNAEEQLNQLNETLKKIELFEVHFQTRWIYTKGYMNFRAVNCVELVELLELSEDQFKQLSQTLDGIKKLEVNIVTDIHSHLLRRFQSS